MDTCRFKFQWDIKNAFKQISRGEINYFKLVSSVGSVDLNELHDRSKDGSDSLEEYKERIGIGSQKSPSQRITDNFCKVARYLELDISKDEDILRMKNFCLALKLFYILIILILKHNY